MALELTLPPDSPLLRQASLLRVYYVKINAMNLLPGIVGGGLPLIYFAVDEEGQRTGPQLPQPVGLPAVAPVWNPRELMMREGSTTYRLSYACVRDHLYAVLGPAVQVLDLL